MGAGSNRRVVVAMSGGVDSSVAALLLVRQGYEVIGMTADLLGRTTGGRCCSLIATGDAKRVCERLGIRHYTVNLREPFSRMVIESFVDYYRRGLTPNPCIACNRFVKFDLMLRIARDLGAELLATGHYARTVEREGRLYLARGADRSKDQSYFLACITPKQLGRLIFPVGELTKGEVRGIAEEEGLVTARKPESQDICFLEDYRSRREFIRERLGAGANGRGLIVDYRGRVLGEHEGIEHFTIGQRSIGVSAGERVYVYRIDPESRTVYVGPRFLLPVRQIRLRELNEITPGSLQPGEVYQVQARYRQRPVPGRLVLDGGQPLIELEEPLEAVAPGQWAVLYREELVLGGGEIASTTLEAEFEEELVKASP